MTTARLASSVEPAVTRASELEELMHLCVEPAAYGLALSGLAVIRPEAMIHDEPSKRRLAHLCLKMLATCRDIAAAAHSDPLMGEAIEGIASRQKGLLHLADALRPDETEAHGRLMQDLLDALDVGCGLLSEMLRIAADISELRAEAAETAGDHEQARAARSEARTFRAWRRSVQAQRARIAIQRRLAPRASRIRIRVPRQSSAPPADSGLFSEHLAHGPPRRPALALVDAA